MKSTEVIAKEVINSVNGDRLEFYRFINFVKIHTLALKIAFRCDREVAWELLSIVLREFEKIGMYMRKYDERVDDIARNLKCNDSIVPLNIRLGTIIEEATKLKDDLEKYHIEMFRNRRKSKQDVNRNNHEEVNVRV